MLVCCDNEGCIIDGKGLSFDLLAMATLRRTIRDSGWAFSICTGRAVPYIEAIVQLLELNHSNTDCVCEGGGVLYGPSTDRHEILADAVNPDRIRGLFPPNSFREELGKVASFTVYPEPGYTVAELHELVLMAGIDGVTVSRSIAAVDVTPAGVDKTFGIVHLLERTGRDWPEVLAIGDSWNDIPMLAKAGVSGCPANAVTEVKAVVDYVSPHPSTLGVADIIRWAVGSQRRFVK
jgi:hydroxymethylpyrimidine pyrophosphatase-like HAD family hydrolase